MEKFRIPKGYKTINKTIRIPNDLVEEIEKYTEKGSSKKNSKDIKPTFSEFVIEALRFALKNMAKK